ncbi:MAG: hypothetical protein WC783_02980 [Candidatus Paceibacterota bacterium]|jgi:hypothetical protein
MDKVKYFEVTASSDCIPDTFVFYNDLSKMFPNEKVVYYSTNDDSSFSLHLFLNDYIYNKSLAKEIGIRAFAIYLERFKSIKDKPKEVKLETLLYE